MKTKKLLAALSVALVLFAAPAARADDSDPEQLFTQASALMEAEKYDQALPKLLEAQRLDPGIGTQFNIAVCYEKLGRLGTAWRNYSEVAQLARASGKKSREDAAREKLAKLEKRVPAFVIKSQGTGDLTVKIDGAALKREEWTFYPVDPGEHEIVATASAKRPWTTKAQTPQEGQRAEIVVPALEVAIDTKLVTVTKETTNTKRTVGFIAGGIGLAGLAVAGVTGFMALDAHATAEKDCTLDNPDDPTRKRCVTAEGRDAVSRGETLLPINAIAFGVGIVGLAAGAFLILTSGKKAEPAKTAIVPAVGPSSGFLSLTRTF